MIKDKHINMLSFLKSDVDIYSLNSDLDLLSTLEPSNLYNSNGEYILIISKNLCFNDFHSNLKRKINDILLSDLIIFKNTICCSQFDKELYCEDYINLDTLIRIFIEGYSQEQLCCIIKKSSIKSKKSLCDYNIYFTSVNFYCEEIKETNFNHFNIFSTKLLSLLKTSGSLFNYKSFCLHCLNVYIHRSKQKKSFLYAFQLFYKINKKILIVLPLIMFMCKANSKIQNFYDIKNIFFYLKLKRKMKHHKTNYILISTPTHGNLGDQAIVLSEINFLKDLNVNSIIEINESKFFQSKEFLYKNLNNNDKIIINGGGNIGTLWKYESRKINYIIKKFKNNKVIVFPETAFFSGPSSSRELQRTIAAINSHDDVRVFLRECQSYILLKNSVNDADAKIFLCPDIVFYLKNNSKLKLKNHRTNSIGLCLRNDLEKILPNNSFLSINSYIKKIPNINIKNFSTVIDKKITKKNREKEVMKKIEEISEFDLVITDRLHAMIFCFLTRTNCIAFNNSNKKVENLYNWIDSDNIFIFNNIKQLENINSIYETLSRKENEILGNFDQLKKELL